MTYPNALKHYTLDPLSEGVYAATACDGGAAISNAGLVDLGDSTLVIDTFLTPTAAEDLRADAQRLTGRTPRWVVNTHYHNDHIWGNQVFLPEADLISAAETRVLIQTAGQQEYDDYRAITGDRLKDVLAQQAAAETDAQRAAFDLWIGYFSGLARDFPRLRVTLPNLVFENRMALHGSLRRAELVAFSGAHTGSDTVAYLPDDGIVFMSDLLFVGFHPYLGDGNPDRWLEVLRSILDGTSGIRNASRFVPGHARPEPWQTCSGWPITSRTASILPRRSRRKVKPGRRTWSLCPSQKPTPAGRCRAFSTPTCVFCWKNTRGRARDLGG